MRGAVEPVDAPEPAERRWVAVAWVDGRLLAVGPSSQWEVTMALAGLGAAYAGVECVGAAEVVAHDEAARRVARVRPKGAAAAGVLRAVPRRGNLPHPKSGLVEVAGKVTTLYSPCHGAERIFPGEDATAGAWLKAVCGVCGTARVVEVQADDQAESGLRACWADTDTDAAGGEGGR